MLDNVQVVVICRIKRELVPRYRPVIDHLLQAAQGERLVVQVDFVEEELGSFGGPWEVGDPEDTDVVDPLSATVPLVPRPVHLTMTVHPDGGASRERFLLWVT